MSDDFDRLRRTMADLSEHGGEADLYDRALRTSRRMTRRRQAAAAGAVAAAVLAVAVPVAIVDRSVAPPVADQSTPVPDATLAPAPGSASPNSVPPSSPPSRTVTSPSMGRSSTPTDGCPVTAKTLTQAAGSPDGWRVVAASITCYQGWAEGREEASDESQQGDGVSLFRYDRGRAKWVKVTEGSALECGEYGVPKQVRSRLPACNPQ